MGMKFTSLILTLLLIIISADSICLENTEDIKAISKLLKKLESSYESKDLESYKSVFAEEGYEYISNMATPDDPSDDVHLVGRDKEIRSAIKVFDSYPEFDLEITSPEISFDENGAEAKSEYRIIILNSGKPNTPDVFYCGGTHVFKLKKFTDGWKIIRWQQFELPMNELENMMREERKDKDVEKLIKEIGHNKLRKWAMAMADLKRIRDDYTELIIDAIKSGKKAARIRLINVLKGTDNDEALNRLTLILKDKNDDIDVRIAAVNALEECNKSKLDSLLIKIAQEDKPQLRAAASLVLSKRIGKRLDEIQQILIAGLKNHNEEVRKASAECLRITTQYYRLDILKERLMDTEELEEVRLAALKSLSNCGSEKLVETLNNILKNDKESLQLRICSAQALTRVKNTDNESLDLLAKIAKDEDENLELRKESILALGKIGHSRVVKNLVKLLNSDVVLIRWSAVSSLVDINDKDALKPLMMILMNRDEDIFIRRLASRGVVNMNRDIAFGPLSQIIKDDTEDPTTRRMAAESLTLIRDERTALLFADFLLDDSQPWWLKRISAEKLGNFKPGISCISRCIDALRYAASSEDEKTANAAQKSLKRLEIKISAKSYPISNNN
ncbi:hypothetical protein GF312_15500 [Candidatus Poribacteria bacterium]|nr:hypothetical protein [Candidatus Poribacteria bacterium]